MIFRIAVLFAISLLLTACGGGPFTVSVEAVDTVFGPMRAMKLTLKEDGEVQIDKIEVNDNSCSSGGITEINRSKTKFKSRGDHIAFTLLKSCGEIYNAKIITVAGDTYDYTF